MKKIGSRICGLTPTLAGLALAVLLFMCSLNGASKQLAEARYLPTRSDQTEIEALKSIIRNLLVESASPRAHSYRYQQQPQEPSQLTYLQRRAAEMSVSSSNGDESDGYLMGQLVPETSASSAQLFKQAKPDRR